MYQSGGVDRREPLAKSGPRHLRWALIEAAQHAARSAYYRPLYDASHPTRRAPPEPATPTAVDKPTS